MISIPKKINPLILENAFHDVEQEKDNTFRIPNSIKADAFGGEAALCQLIITWARKAKENAKLKVYADEADPQSLKKMATTAYGLTALNFASTIETNEGTPISRGKALEQARPFVEAMHAGNPEVIRKFRKTVVPFLCIDNAKELARPIVLYNADGKHLRDRIEYRYLLDSVINEISPRSLWQPSRQFLIDAGSALYEAFCNTEDHARHDLLGFPYSRSIRGFLLAHRTVDKEVLIKQSQWSVPLSHYFKNYPTFGENKNAQFLELSIIDSGAGLAQTWLSKEHNRPVQIREDGVPLRQEVNALIECLKKGNTSSLHVSRGFGLFRIMEAVKNERGFIIIRSGRLSLISDLDQETGDGDLIMKLVDIENGKLAQKHPWASGTLITIMLPLNRQK